MIIGGTGSMQIADSVVKGRFRAVASLENEMHALKRQLSSAVGVIGVSSGYV